MIEYGSATDEELNFLSLCVNNGVSLAIAGSTGSGKTTDLSYLIECLDVKKRVYTIEDTRELNIAKVNAKELWKTELYKQLPRTALIPLQWMICLKKPCDFTRTYYSGRDERRKALTAVEAAEQGIRL